MNDATPQARRFSTRVRVRYAETDQMGVVYHANYLVWCDMARTELIREIGTDYAHLERDGIFLAVADASLRYHAGARYDEWIRIDTRIERVRSRAVRFGYEILRIDPGPETRLVTATTDLIARTPEGRSRTLPSALIEQFRACTAPSE